MSGRLGPRLWTALRVPREDAATSTIQHTDTYREKKSATKGKRREFDRMLADARAGKFSALVVWKIGRFGRSM